MDPYSQHFSLNAQGTCITYFQFLRKIELQLHLTLIGIGVMHLLTIGVGNGRAGLGMDVITLESISREINSPVPLMLCHVGTTSWVAKMDIPFTLTSKRGSFIHSFISNLFQMNLQQFTRSILLETTHEANKNIATL